MTQEKAMRQKQTFTTLDGKTHSVKITMAGRRKIREATEIDLLRAVEQPNLLTEVLTRITEDDEFVLTALGALLDVSTESLEAVADATVYADASTALVEAIVDFFPDSSPIKRPLKLAVENGTILTESRAAMIEATLMQAIGTGSSA